MEEQLSSAQARASIESLAGPDGDMGQLLDSLPLVQGLLAEFAAPDFVCAMVPMPPTPEVVYPGVEGVARAWRDWSEPFASLRAVLEEVHESDTHVVAFVRQVAITKMGGVEIEKPSAVLMAIAGGRVKRLEMHLDRDRALARAGLRPQSSQA